MKNKIKRKRKRKTLYLKRKNFEQRVRNLLKKYDTKILKEFRKNQFKTK